MEGEEIVFGDKVVKVDVKEGGRGNGEYGGCFWEDLVVGGDSGWEFLDALGIVGFV